MPVTAINKLNASCISTLVTDNVELTNLKSDTNGLTPNLSNFEVSTHLNVESCDAQENKNTNEEPEYVPVKKLNDDINVSENNLECSKNPIVLPNRDTLSIIQNDDSPEIINSSNNLSSNSVELEGYYENISSEEDFDEMFDSLSITNEGLKTENIIPVREQKEINDQETEKTNDLPSKDFNAAQHGFYPITNILIQTEGVHSKSKQKEKNGEKTVQTTNISFEDLNTSLPNLNSMQHVAMKSEKIELIDKCTEINGKEILKILEDSCFEPCNNIMPINKQEKNENKIVEHNISLDCEFVLNLINNSTVKTDEILINEPNKINGKESVTNSTDSENNSDINIFPNEIKKLNLAKEFISKSKIEEKLMKNGVKSNEISYDNDLNCQKVTNDILQKSNVIKKDKIITGSDHFIKKENFIENYGNGASKENSVNIKISCNNNQEIQIADNTEIYQEKCIANQSEHSLINNTNETIQNIELVSPKTITSSDLAIALNQSLENNEKKISMLTEDNSLESTTNSTEINKINIPDKSQISINIEKIKKESKFHTNIEESTKCKLNLNKIYDNMQSSFLGVELKDNVVNVENRTNENKNYTKVTNNLDNINHLICQNLETDETSRNIQNKNCINLKKSVLNTLNNVESLPKKSKPKPIFTKITTQRNIIKQLRKQKISRKELFKFKSKYKSKKRKRLGVHASKINRFCTKNLKTCKQKRLLKRYKLTSNKSLTFISKYKEPESESSETDNDLLEKEGNDEITVDDIRNKIKQQLQLLRDKKPTKPIFAEDNIVETKRVQIAPSVEIPSSDSTPEVSNKYSIAANLDDVLLSNDSEHVIVSVVGGYVSDEDNCKESSVNSVLSTNSKKSRISMTEILLKRGNLEVNNKNNEENVDINHVIKLSKTKDKTKIKGWRSKQFDASEINLIEVTPEVINEEHKIEENPEVQKVIPLPYYSDEPVASTSLYFPNVEQLSVSMGVEDLDKTTSVSSNNSHMIVEKIKMENETIEIKTEKVYADSETKVKQKNSAFVSDMLDTFLNEHAQLKISYEVPKLKAEETITKPVSNMPVLQSGNVEKPVVKQISSKTEIRVKPKTLAEKRRMMELERKNELISRMELNESVYMKQFERNEKRNRCEFNKKIIDTIISDDAPFSRLCWQMATKYIPNVHQFAQINNEKIRIMGGTENKDFKIKHIYSTKNVNTTGTDEKLEGTKSGIKRIRNKLDYKPGPLCKKPKLLKTSDTDEWEYKILKLPKIKLLLYPEYCKPIAPLAEKYLQFCKDEKGFISNEWAKFAVSAVATNKKSRTPIEFELPYANKQNKVIVRKTRLKKKEDKMDKSLSIVKNNVDNKIETILSEMVNCIVNQELDAKIVKEDPDLYDLSQNNDDNYRPLSPLNTSDHTIIKRRNTKRSKTTLELRRLNVQVIEVDVQEEIDDDNSNNSCSKDHCRLGCVCKSLSGLGNGMPDHCGREQCMLNCLCSKNSNQSSHHSITLPAGTDLLSATTMVRLQDEAKRHLAKEEKKFTQTVIKANNQTIVVGGGARDRQRRVSKLPKKYNDFVNTTDELATIQANTISEIVEPKKPVEKPSMKKFVPIWNKPVVKSFEKPSRKYKINNCYVNTDNLKNLENVIPWCMVHNLYKCYCKGNIVEEHLEVVEKPKIEDNSILNEYISYSSRYNCTRHSVQDNGTSTTQDQQERYCARTRTLGNNFYLLRNRSQAFKQKYAKIRKDQEECDTFCEEIDNKSSAIMLNDIDVSEKDDLLVINKKRTRKQKFSNLDESNELFEFELPKKSKTQMENKKKCCEVEKIHQDSISFGGALIDYEKSFNGLLFPTQTASKRFIELFGYDPCIYGNIRLVEWETLVERYKNNTIQLWFNSKRYTRGVLLTENKRRPSRNHVNIKLFKNTPIHTFKVPLIITSLLSDSLPGETSNAKETFIIMANNSIDWESRGSITLSSVCCKFHLITKPTPDLLLFPANMLSSYIAKSETIIIEKETIPAEAVIQPLEEKDPLEIIPRPISLKSSPSMSIEIISKDQEKIPEVVNSLSTYYKGVEITKIPVTTIPTVIEPDVTIKSVPTSMQRENSDLNQVSEKYTLFPGLPTVSGFNYWYTLTLESDFSVLHLTFTNFYIKYTHLSTAIQMARQNKKTVRIRSQHESQINFNHYGVYAVPEYDNKIFFGPYQTYPEHGLETFRYINGKLVNTKIYNKIQGNINKKPNGLWFIHKSTANNGVSLELLEVDCSLINNDCSIEIVNPINTKRPQIEFVDLTENDSDEDMLSSEIERNSNTDPLRTTFKVDNSKSKASDSVYEFKSGLVIRHVNNESQNIPKIEDDKPDIVITSTSGKKRKKRNTFLQESKKQKKPVECIELNDEMSKFSMDFTDTSAVLIPEKVNEEKRKKIPELYPIHPKSKKIGIKKTMIENQSAVIYIITNIPGVGFIDVFPYNGKYYLSLNSEFFKSPFFYNIQGTIKWVHLLFKKYMFYVPSDLNVKFSIIRNSKEVPDMPRFIDRYFNGDHMICRKGIFDLVNMASTDINELGLDEKETTSILSKKCELLMQKSIYNSENLTSEEDVINGEKLLQVAPYKMKVLELKEEYLVNTKKNLLETQKQLINKINSLLQEVPENVRKISKKNISAILKNSTTPVIDITDDKPTVKKINFKPSNKINTTQSPSNCTSVKLLPAGKLCKIVEGKVMVMENLTATATGPSLIKKSLKTGTKKVNNVNIIDKQMVNPLKFKIVNNSVVVPLKSINKSVSIIDVTQPGTSILKTSSKFIDLTKN